ncbi:S8 family serine peptidase [Paraburkholderia sp.]|uniref:S8 family serine peptidase n=1 Tax=Paraburkholderia sp. TaxID=1926495 RepID=UPI00239A8C0C|nr:S8 family serine peptidase [Paraburkholderia sp.]MDE1182940.1 S8 family serine peptidase [Paraburkholderia sp.]
MYRTISRALGALLLVVVAGCGGSDPASLSAAASPVMANAGLRGDAPGDTAANAASDAASGSSPTIDATPADAQPAPVSTDTFNARSLQAGASNQRFIVKYRTGTVARRDAASVEPRVRHLKSSSAPAARHLRRLATGADVIVTERPLDRADAEAFMRQLATDPDVEYVEPDATMHTQMVPNDPSYSGLWAFNPSTFATRWPGGMNMEPAWDITNGAGIVIAELDTGVTHHRDLDANVLPGIDFINGRASGDGHNPGGTGEGCAVTWHGTHVAGTLAAVANNREGIVGTAWGAKLLPVRVLSPCGNGLASDVADGIVWASGGDVPGAPLNRTPARVLNLSLSGNGACSRAYQDAIDGAVSRGTTVVVAAGNDGADATNFQPGNCNNVITVGAHNGDGQRVGFSNFGPAVTLSAPGVTVYSAWNTGTAAPDADNYIFLNGTSMATAHASGVVALMQSAAAKPLTPMQVRSVLINTLRPFPVALDRPIGAGMVDGGAAVAAARAGRLPPVADFSFARTFDQQITYTDTSSAGASPIVSRVWDFGLGTQWQSPDASVRPYFNYEYVGTYNVSLTITDSAGVSNRVTKSVTIDPPPVTPLSLGRRVSGLSGSLREVLYFAIDVPQGVSSLTFTTSGGNNKAVLYVQRDVTTLTRPLCTAAINTGSEATCKFDAPTPGTYYAMLYGRDAFSGATLVASYLR